MRGKEDHSSSAARARSPYPEVDALVAIMNDPVDLEIAERNRWYRIPCQSAPDALGHVRYLAFYHTKVFGPLRWAVHYWAPVVSIERTVRRDLLPDESEHPRADEPYFRVNIGALHELDRPIPSRRLRRIVFIPTTMAKLHQASEINDLFHDSPLEDRLWEAFKLHGIEGERQYYVAERSISYCLDFALLCEQGGIDVECDGDTWHINPDAASSDNARDNRLTVLGWSILRFSSQALKDDAMPSTVDSVKHAINRKGGLVTWDHVNRRFRPGTSEIAQQLRLW